MLLYCCYLLLLLTAVAEYGLVDARDDPYCKDYLPEHTCQMWLNTLCKNEMLKKHNKAHCAKTCGLCYL
ncbi:shTK domain protein [Ancylostoma caninum]|uniref:ShTK domain protein n=1 Tax=Ancylostoma caninum TaxID=29170 RepID=A0A368GGA1_ANCCA|nr:shTK domain protein [Ancylostoma caninum]